MEMTESQYLRLLMKHESKLRAYGYTILPNWTRLDDAMQDASIVIWEKRGELASEDQFSALGAGDRTIQMSVAGPAGAERAQDGQPEGAGINCQ